MKKIFLVFAFVILCVTVSHAQDTIRTKSDTIIGKVVEIGIDEIKYKAYDNLNGPVIVIEKRNVMEITYENGKKTYFGPDAYEASPEVEIRNKTHCIKFEFFAPLTNDIAFGYETMLKVGVNLEFKVGIIGPGFAQHVDEMDGHGVFLKAGVKFLTSPTYVQRGVKYAHSLKGFYIKPELIYSTFTIVQDFYSSTGGSYSWFGYSGTVVSKEVRYNNGALNIVFGKQHLLGNAITLDYYFGIGYGFQNSSFNDNSFENPGTGYCYSHTYGGSDSPIVFSGGLTIGVPF